MVDLGYLSAFLFCIALAFSQLVRNTKIRRFEIILSSCYLLIGIINAYLFVAGKPHDENLVLVFWLPIVSLILYEETSRKFYRVSKVGYLITVMVNLFWIIQLIKVL